MRFYLKSLLSNLKYFTSQLSNSYISSLEHEDCTYTDAQDKANVLNSVFGHQTLLDDENADVPEDP